MSSSNSSASVGAGQSAQGTTAIALFTAIGTAFAIFAAQISLFELLRNKLSRIYRPKTYLVPERERTRDPGWTPLAWLSSIFTYRDREVIAKCGLDAYFFLRYLQTLLVIFVPLAMLILPILLPMNAIHGRGTSFEDPTSQTGTRWNVTGLDTLAWGNVSPYHTHRYWAHLILAVVVVVWVCIVFFFELRVYIRVRQDFLTSAEHRLTASATTILVSTIPKKWLTYEALEGLFDVFPGGIRNIWINRNYDGLLDKIDNRFKVQKKLESAETELIKKCKKAQKKQATKDEHKVAKKSGMKKPTKGEKELRNKNEDAEANRRAARDQGVSGGDPHEVAHTVEEAIDDAALKPHEIDPEAGDPDGVGDEVDDRSGGILMRGVGGLRQNLGRGLGVVGKEFEKVGHTIAGAGRLAGQLDNELDTTPGYVPMERSQTDADERRPPVPPSNIQYRESNDPRSINSANSRLNEHRKIPAPSQNVSTRRGVAFEQPPATSTPAQNQASFEGTRSEASLNHATSEMSQSRSTELKLKTKDGNTDNWIKFWRGPAVGYPSPNPHGFEDDEFPFKSRDEGEKSNEPSGLLAKLRHLFKKEPVEENEYPEAFNAQIEDDGPGEPLWKKYIKESDRPRHRLPRFSFIPDFLPTIPLISKGKVDTIYWCRKELARLNVEIRLDQEEKDNELKYPLMNSAFIQFNHQIAAHMACQAVSYHIPKQMAPRDVEIAPMDVIWGNMSIKWWEAWIRTVLVLVVVSGMIILWFFPVAGTALLGNLPLLIQRVPWLGFLNNNPVVRKAINALAGVLPALGLTILLAVVPPIFYALAKLQGAKTLVQKELSVQNYYFFFLFVQVFLVVSITTGALTSLSSHLGDVTSIPEILAENLPKSSNYFFSYMTLQAFGNSSGALLQYVTLILWFVLPRIIDSTARDKWNRATSLQTVKWGTYFPTYTNFACIGLIYSVISPMILVFAVITFSLYWVANRYCMLYIFKLHTDTGGLLYPRAINQTFTGLYVMELCMVGLFFLVEDQDGRLACVPQAIIMVILTGFTVLFQILLNQSFGPLFRHLPITLEDDAVFRDEQFERMEFERIAQEERGVDEQSDTAVSDNPHKSMHGDDIEMGRLSQTVSAPEETPMVKRFDPRNGLTQAVTWATKGSRTVAGITGTDAMIERHRRKLKDIEKQQAELAGVFFGGNDELEDLSPRQRNELVKGAFKHSALREKQPAVWIPRDDIGISDDEITRTVGFSPNIWVSNTGAGLDSKLRVIFQQNPPDFSEVDHIRL